MAKIDFSDLIERKLIHEKKYDNGLRILKYKKNVFFNNLWDVDNRLLDARGIVLDNENNIIVRPFRKIFNYGENETTVNLGKEVIAVEKVNGFMACITLDHKYGRIVSTTGTLDSDYVKLANAYLDKLANIGLVNGCTYIFEICHPDDPHIVDQEFGMYLIGIREIENGILWHQQFLDNIAEYIQMKGIDVKRPTWGTINFSDLLQRNQKSEIEGYVVIDPHTNDQLLKLKSPYYLTKKFLMRMSANKIQTMFDNPILIKKSIDEEFYGIVDYIRNVFDEVEWEGFDEQTRRGVIETYFNSTSK